MAAGGGTARSIAKPRTRAGNRGALAPGAAVPLIETPRGERWSRRSKLAAASAPAGPLVSWLARVLSGESFASDADHRASRLARALRSRVIVLRPPDEGCTVWPRDSSPAVASRVRHGLRLSATPSASGESGRKGCRLRSTGVGRGLKDRRSASRNALGARLVGSVKREVRTTTVGHGCRQCAFPALRGPEILHPERRYVVAERFWDPMVPAPGGQDGREVCRGGASPRRARLCPPPTRRSQAFR